MRYNKFMHASKHMLNKIQNSGVVAQCCNPDYSRGSDWEDQGSKPTPAKSSPDPISISGLVQFCAWLSSLLHG
jgi:hypothetical protein